MFTKSYRAADCLVDPMARLWRKATLSYKSLFAAMSWQQYAMVHLGSPLMQLLCFSLLSRYVYGRQDLGTWLIGNALLMTYFNAIFGVGSQLSSEKHSGTLPLLIASPSSRAGIFLPRTCLHILDGLVAVFLGFAVAALLFGFRLRPDQWAAFVLVFAVASLCAMSFGLIISCLGLLTRDLNLILNISSSLLLGLTGANFPLSRLPAWLQGFSQALPLTRSIALCRAIQAGAKLTENWQLLLGEVLLALAFMSLGVFLFRLIEGIAIKRGVLELF